LFESVALHFIAPVRPPAVRAASPEPPLTPGVTLPLGPPPMPPMSLPLQRASQPTPPSPMTTSRPRGTTPPPVPFFRSRAITLTLDGNRLTVRGPDAGVFGYQEQLAPGTRYSSMHLPADKIWRVRCVSMADDPRVAISIEGAFHNETTGKESQTERWLGPLSSYEATAVVHALETKLGLPRPVAPVNEAQLIANPAAYASRFIDVTANWDRRGYYPRFAGARLVSDAISGRDDARYRVIGWFQHYVPGRTPMMAPGDSQCHRLMVVRIERAGRLPPAP
jgi:hypothetical protein